LLAGTSREVIESDTGLEELKSEHGCDELLESGRSCILHSAA
jgi:hypothetical protein